MNTTQKGLISLLKSAVTGEKLEFPPDFSPKEAVALGGKQGVLCLLYQGAVHCGVNWDADLMNKLRQVGYRNLLRSEGQLGALQKLYQAFEDRGIDYLPLKGCCLKELYPKPELRPMGDADILIRPGQFSLASGVMETLGYTRKAETEHTDNWVRPELYVELHRSPVPMDDREFYDYYGDGWGRAVKTGGHRFDLSAEDHFIFLLTHFARHYRDSGIGCRHVLDLYVYLRAFPALDGAYLDREIEKLGLTAFYANVQRLLETWFAGKPEDEVTALMTAFVFSGGVWGTLEAGMYAQTLKNTRNSRGAWLQTLFPPLEILRNRYGILRKAPILLPVMWVVRWLDVALFSRKNVSKKLNVLRNMDKQALEDRKRALEIIGINWE